ncbi:MAG: hypothetical protein Q8M08_04865 [Bacteroidales bacterium]|nr:hypothetical protein [Bacteroidales bacterium]
MTQRIFLFTALLYLTCGICNHLSGQRFQSVRQAEDTLMSILSDLNMAGSDSSKIHINQKFFDVLYSAITLSSSDNYPFDSLKTLVKISSPDQKFQIFQWNLPTSDGKHRYYGFIKVPDHDPPLIYRLVDMTDSLPAPDTLFLDNLHWLGALYYKIIPGTTVSGRQIYTLLGWAGRNPMLTQKIIEILYFDESDIPHFGLKLFPDYAGGNMTRIIFRFSASTSMSMKYEKQTISSDKRWNSKKRRFDFTLKEIQMIVCERLVPLDPDLEGQYQFYVAAGDLFDGFTFINGRWTYTPGIDFLNRK